MASDEEIFERAMSQFGPPLSLDRLPPAAARVFRRWIAIANDTIAVERRIHSAIPPIYFGFVDNNDVQACAFKSDGRYFIAVFTGAITHCARIFSRMMADARILPTCGDVSKEIIFSPMASDTDSMVRCVDAVRDLYSLHFQEQAIRFLVAHEVCHISHGHVDYLEATQGNPMVPELCWRPSSAGEALTLQAMEMDADSIAACHVTRIIKLYYSTNRQPAAPWDRFYVDVQHTAFLCSFAIATFFRIFGDDVISGKDLTVLSHPPFRARMWISTMVIGSYVFEKWDQALAMTFGKAIGEAIAAVEDAFIKLLGTRQFAEGLREVADGTAQAYAETLQEHWKNIVRPGLLQHTFNQNLPE